MSEFNSLPDTKTVNTPSTCPTAVVAFTPDKTAVPFAVTVVVPTEVSNSFSDPATIVVVASACIDYGPITVVNCSPVTITSGSTCISPNCVFKRFVVNCIVGLRIAVIDTDPTAVVSCIPVTSTLALVPPSEARGDCAIAVIPNISLQ